MKTIKMPNAPIAWPNKCAYCNGAPDTQLVAECSVVTKARYYVFFIRYHTTRSTIHYPICNKHKLVASVASAISRRSLLNLGLSLVFVIYPAIVLLSFLFLLIFRGTQAIRPDANYGSLVIMTLMLAAGPCVYLFCLFYTPVKINNATEALLKITFSNADFAAEFKEVNQNPIVQGRG